MLPFEFTATPVTSPRYRSFGSLSGSEASNGICGTASCANAGDASSTSNPTSGHFMTSSFAWVFRSGAPAIAAGEYSGRRRRRFAVKILAYLVAGPHRLYCREILTATTHDAPESPRHGRDRPRRRAGARRLREPAAAAAGASAARRAAGPDRQDKPAGDRIRARRRRRARLRA